MGKIRLNENAEIVKTVQEGLRATGGFCHCQVERTPENKCICKEVSVKTSGDLQETRRYETILPYSSG